MKGVALVTGASQGLGLEWCKQLAERGYHVLLSARNSAQAEEAASRLSELNLSVSPLQMDVCDEEQIRETAAKIEAKFGTLDVLVNNAGINSGTRAKGNVELQQKNLSLDQLDPQEVLNMLHINALAPILVAKHFRSLLRNSGQGKIINIGSWLGSISLKQSGGNYSYAVSKSALNMMNRALAYDLLPDGISSVVVNPGWVQTNMGGSKAQFTTEQAVQNLIENVLMKITPAESGQFFNFDGSIHPW